MAYTPIINVSISINATPLTQQGFGTPLFITAHRNTPDRVIEVSSVDELTTTWNFEADSPAVRAARQVFGQQPAVPTLKIGRRDMNGTVTPAAPTAATASVVYNFGISAELEGGAFATTITATIDNSGDDQEQEDAVDALVAAFGTITEYQGILAATKLGAGASATLQVSSVALGDDSIYFTMTSQAEVDLTTVTFAAFEAPSDTIAAITQIDSDWYFVAVEERSNNSYILQMVTALSGLDHLFFFSSSDVENLSAYQAGNPDLFAQLRDNNADRAVTFFHHLADQYVELGWVGVNAPFDAGSINWSNVQINNVGFSQDPSRGRPLTTTQKGNLLNKNANFVELDAGAAYTRTGKTAGGEWIDVVRGVDWQSADMAVNLRALLLNQKGGKVPYTDVGTALVREVISSSLQRGVNRQFLDAFEVFVPLVRDISQADRLARLLTGVTFEGTLAGAINEITVIGTVTV